MLKKFGKACKEKMAEEMLSRFEKHPNFFITSYMGLTNLELEVLRKNLRKNSSSYFIVKNAILNVIFDKLKLKDMGPMVEGGVGISLSGEDSIATSKTLVGFTKEYGKLKIKGAYLDGTNISTDRVREMASLPAKEVLLALVMGGMKSPITGFVYVLSGVARKFVYCLDAIKNKKAN